MESGAAVDIRVYGEVQGVGFRWFVAHRATELGLRGFVRNTADGGVEVHAEGSRMSLEVLITHVRIGPRSAVVGDVQTDWSTPTGAYATFEIKH
ncbi:MAG: acylphosphatase [Bacteroidota bacterium]